MDPLTAGDTRADWAGRLAGAGAPLLAELMPWVADADPEGRVADRSRMLCAGLSELATACYRSLGGERHTAPLASAAALLSLLTKIDDQEIDGAPFHGGRGTDRALLRERTTRYLAPTLDSLRDARAATPEPRCQLAAELGRRLVTLDPAGDRRADLLATVARGWAIQVEAVATFTAHPGATTGEQVARVTADISGVWLMMIAMVGTLPADARRGLSPDERRAFLSYGGWIQRADALADLGRDVADGLIATVPGLHSWEHAGDSYLRACDDVDLPALYGLTATVGADAACVPPAGALAALDARLAGLGELPALLRWIHAFLLSRYLAHPACRRSGREPAFARHALAPALHVGQNDPADHESVLGYVNPAAVEDDPCSAR